MTTGIIIQARMTSKRFPGKVMAVLAGKPLLQRVIERCRMVQGINRIIVAMPSGLKSRPISDLCEKMDVYQFHGSEKDVLHRYFDAAACHGLTTIMRITGDCPYIDPFLCGEVLEGLITHKADYCSNVYPRRSYPKGLDCEAFTFDCLEAAHLKATKQYDREHVTPWMQRTEGIIRVLVVQPIDTSELNWCVDYPEDIVRLEKLSQEQEERKLAKSN